MQDEGTHESERTNNSSGSEDIPVGMKRHKIKEEEVKILAIESNTWPRKMREAVEITLTPEMNRDNGYDLPAIY